MKTNDSHIIGLEIENFHRITTANLEIPDGPGLVKITGKNKHGKSSVLYAIAAVLGGEGQVLPSAVNDEAENGTGFVTLKLSNGYTIERRFTEKAPKGYLTITDPKGKKSSSQGTIGGMIGSRSFDPLAIFQLKPKPLRKVFLSLSTNPNLEERLDQIHTRRDIVTEERRPHEAIKLKANMTKAPVGDRPEPVDVSGEMERLKGLQARLKYYTGTADDLRDLKADGLKRVEALQKARAALVDAQAEMDEQRGSLTRAELDFLELTDPAEEIHEVEARISEADERNEALEPWKEHDRSKREAREAMEKATPMTAELTDLEAQESALLSDAGIPVEGLSFDAEGEVILNGRPLAVASGAEKIQMAVDVAVAANPDLKACLVDEANDMDLEMLEALYERALATGFQIFICRIGLEGKGQVEVVDGCATVPS